MATIKPEYLTKKVRKKDGAYSEVKYRIDATFIPASISEISDLFIINYCVANDKEEWLYNKLEETEKATANKDRRVKAVVNGKEQHINVKAGEVYQQPKSFVSLRSDFANEFFPDIVKGGKKADSPLDDFKKKYAAKMGKNK